MQILEQLFTDLFQNPRITDERLGTFGLDHFTKINNNNPGGVFDAIKQATSDVLQNFAKAIEDEGGNIGDRKADTVTKNQARKNFNAYIRQHEGLVKSKFGETSEPYMQFFPNGLTPFSHVTDTGYGLLIDNIVIRAEQYETELGTPFKDDVTALALAYKRAEYEQTDEKGAVSGDRGQIAVLRAEVTKQFTINALTIALQFPLDATKEKVYFDTSLLFAAKRKHIYKGKPEPNTDKLIAKIKYAGGKELHMKNKGATVLTFQMHLNGSPVGNSFTVQPGKTLNKREDEFFSNADELWVNNNGNAIGQYEVVEVA